MGNVSAENVIGALVFQREGDRTIIKIERLI